MDAICKHCGGLIWFIPLYGKGTVEWCHNLGLPECREGGTTAEPGPIDPRPYLVDDGWWDEYEEGERRESVKWVKGYTDSGKVETTFIITFAPRPEFSQNPEDYR